jgi:hypothetical protein
MSGNTHKTADAFKNITALFKSDMSAIFTLVLRAFYFLI